MQTHEQRQYWANRRKNERRQNPGRQVPKARGSIVLMAHSLKEFDQLRRDHPDMKVKYDSSLLQQTELFDTREMIDV